jgi:hypothetical protein
MSKSLVARQVKLVAKVSRGFRKIPDCRPNGDI